MVERLIKWCLVALGAFLLVNLFVDRWGWPAAVWFLGAPAVYGFLRGIFKGSRT